MSLTHSVLGVQIHFLLQNIDYIFRVSYNEVRREGHVLEALEASPARPEKQALPEAPTKGAAGSEGQLCLLTPTPEISGPGPAKERSDRGKTSCQVVVQLEMSAPTQQSTLSAKKGK